MNTLILLLLLATSSQVWSQEGSYIIKREMFKTSLASINFSPDGTLLLAGFYDGSFRLLDPETLETKLEVLKAHYKAVNAMDMTPKMDFIL
jgi:WD40 repeat protein